MIKELQALVDALKSADEEDEVDGIIKQIRVFIEDEHPIYYGTGLQNIYYGPATGIRYIFGSDPSDCVRYVDDRDYHAMLRIMKDGTPIFESVGENKLKLLEM